MQRCMCCLPPGLLLWPRSRNWIAYLDQNFYWSHGLNAGGYNAVGDNGRMRWPAGRHGMCGDAWNESRWDTPGPVQATYVEGQVRWLREHAHAQPA